MVNVGTYTIRGSYGIGHTSQPLIFREHSIRFPGRQTAKALHRTQAPIFRLFLWICRPPSNSQSPPEITTFLVRSPSRNPGMCRCYCYWVGSIDPSWNLPPLCRGYVLDLFQVFFLRIVPWYSSP